MNGHERPESRSRARDSVQLHKFTTVVRSEHESRRQCTRPKAGANSALCCGSTCRTGKRGLEFRNEPCRAAVGEEGGKPRRQPLRAARNAHGVPLPLNYGGKRSSALQPHGKSVPLPLLRLDPVHYSGSVTKICSAQDTLLSPSATPQTSEQASMLHQAPPSHPFSTPPSCSR